MNNFFQKKIETLDSFSQHWWSMLLLTMENRANRECLRFSRQRESFPTSTRLSWCLFAILYFVFVFYISNFVFCECLRFSHRGDWGGGWWPFASPFHSKSGAAFSPACTYLCARWDRNISSSVFVFVFAFAFAFVFVFVFVFVRFFSSVHLALRPVSS